MFFLSNNFERKTVQAKVDLQTFAIGPHEFLACVCARACVCVCVRAACVYVSSLHVGLASEAAKMSVISGDPDSPHPSNVTLERVTAQVREGHPVTITCTISKAQAMGRYWLCWYKEE